MSDNKQSLSFQLSYGDCDTVGIAYYAIFYPWMERAYSTWLYSHGIRSGELLERFDIYTVGMQSQCRYLAQCGVFDTLTTQLVRRHIGVTSFIVGCDFRRGDVLITQGEISFACRGRDHKKSPIPTELLAALNSLPEPAVAG